MSVSSISEATAKQAIEAAMRAKTGYTQADHPRYSSLQVRQIGACDGERRYDFAYGGVYGPFMARGNVTFPDPTDPKRFTVLIAVFQLFVKPGGVKNLVECTSEELRDAALDAIHPNPAAPDHVGAEATQL